MNPNENELYHHGIKGMHWGVRRTPEQLGYKRVGKRHKGKDSKKERLEETKQKILNSGDAKLIFANRKMFTNEELQRGINRINSEITLKRLASDNAFKESTRRADRFVSDVANRTGNFRRAISNIVSIATLKDVSDIVSPKNKGGKKSGSYSDVVDVNYEEIFHSDEKGEKRDMTNELYHHGIKGQKWGVRRFQNPDGTWTKLGYERAQRMLKKTGRIKKAVVATAPLAGAALTAGGAFLASGNPSVAGYAAGVSFITGLAAARSSFKKIDEQTNRQVEDLLNKLGDKKYKDIRDTTKPQKKDSLDKKIPNYKKKSTSPNSLFDIDDPELIDLYIDDPDFRKEYGVSDSDYKKYLENT